MFIEFTKMFIWFRVLDDCVPCHVKKCVQHVTKII